MRLRKNVLLPFGHLCSLHMGECSLGFATRGATVEMLRNWGCKEKHPGLIELQSWREVGGGWRG